MSQRSAPNDTPLHDACAGEYDRQVREYRCTMHDVLFGLCFECVHPGDRLLDIGIGTGLSSLPFARLGVQVSGFDESAKMLDQCRAKGIAADLRQMDIRTRPWPYPDSCFQLAVACGVFHFLGDLDPVFAEIARVLRPQGILTCTVKVPAPPNHSRGCLAATGDYTIEETGDATVYAHTEIYVLGLLERHRFQVLKEARLLAATAEGPWAATFAAYVAGKQQA